MVTRVKNMMMMKGQRLKLIVGMVNIGAIGVIGDMMNIDARRVSEGE